jgi:hypothetical protein
MGKVGFLFGILGFGMMLYEAVREEEGTEYEGTEGPED